MRQAGVARSGLLVPLIPLALLYLVGVVGDRYLLTVLTFASLFAVFATTLNFIAAYVGQVNLGHAVFFGAGSYVAAYVNVKLGIPWWLSLPAAAAVSLLAGLVLGLLTLRTKGPFLLLVTALVNIVVLHLVYSFSEFTGGEDGITGVTRITANPLLNYYIMATYMLAVVVTLRALIQSRLGYGFRVIAEDEDLAEALGIDVVKHKLLAFVISAFFTGLLGGLYAHYLGVAGPGTLSFDLTFQALVMAILGGWGTLYGPVIGSFIVTSFNEYLRVIGLYRTLIVGAATLVVLLKFRKGVYDILRERILRPAA
jgi:branched-chain amino acid transport system permease protein